MLIKDCWDAPAKGYISSHYNVLERQYAFIKGLTAVFNDDTHRLLCHLIVSQLVSFENTEPWIPISWNLINKHLPKADWKALVEAGLIDYREHDRLKHKSREYRVKDNLLKEFVRKGFQPGEDLSTNKRVNLFTGAHIRKITGNQYRDEANCPEPDLIQSALKRMQQGIFNKTEVDKYLLLLPVDSPKYLQAMSCYNTLMGQQPQPTEHPDLYTFQNAYRTSYTGRLYFIGGGLQNAPRPMKAAAYSGIENVHNYDLVSSQINCLLIELKDAGLDTVWLDEYLETPNAKEIYAKKVGISSDLWKQCLCALLFGAYFKRQDGMTIYDHLKAEYEKVEPLNTVYDELKVITKPLRQILQEWHEFLYEKHVKSNGAQFIYNAVQKRLKRSDLLKDKPSLAQRKLAAFILQGRESCFIQHLTVLSEEYGYKVISNEHDGLVTVGEIPDEAVQEAAQKSGFSRAELKEKPWHY